MYQRHLHVLVYMALYSASADLEGSGANTLDDLIAIRENSALRGSKLFRLGSEAQVEVTDSNIHYATPKIMILVYLLPVLSMLCLIGYMHHGYQHRGDTRNPPRWNPDDPRQTFDNGCED